jgi:hypothetical protein
MGWIVVIVLLPIVFAVLMAVLVVKAALVMFRLFVVFAVAFAAVVDEIAVPRRLPS